MQSKMFSDRASWGLFVLRVVLGAIFIAHGWQKIQGIDMVIGFFGKIGLGTFAAYSVAWTELLAGVCILFGIFTRIAGYALIIVMLCAMYFLKLKMGFVGGYELDLVLLASALAIAWTGPGMFSIAGRVCGCGKCMLCGGSVTNYVKGKMGKNCDNCENCKETCSRHETKA